MAVLRRGLPIRIGNTGLIWRKVAPVVASGPPAIQFSLWFINNSA